MDRDGADEALVRAAREPGSEDELATQLHVLRNDLTAPASPQARWNHLAAMRRAASDPTVELPVDATDALPVATEVPRRRSHRAVVLVAAATVGVLGLTGGLAAAGRLPRPAQDRVADFAKVVGVDLPKHDDSSSDIQGPAKARTTPGSTGSAPAVGPRGPGATGTLPGSSGSAPGHSPTGRENAPGRTKDRTGDTGTTVPPGSSGSAPGQTDGTPDDSGNAPGHTKGTTGDTGTTSPGNSGSAPGQNKGTDGPGSTPGQSGSAPGQEKKATMGSTVGPGNSDIAPGHNQDTAGSPSVHGADQ
jgi:hypothetical protein